MSGIGTLARQSSHYFAGRVVIMAAGFVSFPVLTRVLSVGDYGLLGLLNTTLFILIAVTKLGFPNAVVRFLEEYRSRNKWNEFTSTIVWGAVAVSGLVASCVWLFCHLLGQSWWDAKVDRILTLFPFLVFAACTTDVFMSFLRAEQRSRLYNVLAVARRYGTLAAGISLAVLLSGRVYGYFLGYMIASCFFLGIVGWIFRKRVSLSRGILSGAVLIGAVRFGFPLVWAELGDLVLNYADRYLIEMFLGREPLGLYTAGYNLATYVTAVLIQPINYAMTPIYMKILVEKGEAETREFFRRLLRGFILLIAPIVCIFVATGRDLILLLASSKYAGASSVLGYVVVGQAVYACTLIVNCGLFIAKKTQVVTYLMLSACIANIGLNVVLIPHLGILGAAQATLISYVLYAVAIGYFSFRQFRFPVEYGHISLYVAIAFCTYLVIRGIHLQGNLLNLCVKGCVGAGMYGLLVCWTDREVGNRLFLAAREVLRRSG